MVSLPPHTTPAFGLGFFGPFGKYYDDIEDVYERTCRQTTWQVAEILNVACRKAASVQNAVIYI